MSIIANLCPIMIHLNALDFNVCRSEEMISFFWRSVYFYLYPSTLNIFCRDNLSTYLICDLIWYIWAKSILGSLTQWSDSCGGYNTNVGFIVLQISSKKILWWWSIKRQNKNKQVTIYRQTEAKTLRI